MVAGEFYTWLYIVYAFIQAILVARYWDGDLNDKDSLLLGVGITIVVAPIVSVVVTYMLARWCIVFLVRYRNPSAKNK